MRIAIIAPSSTFQTDDLQKEINVRGHKSELLNLREIDITNPEKDSTIKALLSYDIVYFRNGADRVTKMILGRTLSNKGTTFINSGYFTDPLLSDKFYQMHTVSKAGISTPKTFSLKEPKKETFQKFVSGLGLPFVIKPATGAQGKGVQIIREQSDFEKRTSNRSLFKTLIQEYIPNDGDYRVLVINHKAIGTYNRVPPEGDFRANISQGGSGEKVTESKFEKRLMEMAEKVTPLLGLEIAGIDIMKSSDTGELYFIESNSIPQWEGFKATTGINVSGKIVDYFETISK